MSKYNPESSSLESQIEFLSTLVQAGPVYSSIAGQQACVDLIAGQLENFAWDNVEVQPYKSGDLADDPHYIPVNSFGKEYEDDETRPKHNIIATLEANKPGRTLILNGHYDVEPVSDEPNWKRAWNSGAVENGFVWGRGTSDMLGGLTSQLYVASRLAEDRDSWSGKVIFNAVADEEIGGNGTLASLHELSRIGLIEYRDLVSCLIAEPSSRVIAQESLGFLHMILRANGSARHMAGIALKENVLYEMIDTINDFEQSLDQAAKTVNPEIKHIKHVFGLIEGGVDAATPMPLLQAESTIFHPVDISVAELQNTISAILAKSSPNIDVGFSDFSFEGHRSPTGNLSTKLNATRPNTSISLGDFPSPCDARLFGHFGVKDVVIYGPGSLDQAHTTDENIAIEDIELYNRHLEAAIRAYLNQLG